MSPALSVSCPLDQQQIMVGHISLGQGGIQQQGAENPTTVTSDRRLFSSCTKKSRGMKTCSRKVLRTQVPSVFFYLPHQELCLRDCQTVAASQTDELLTDISANSSQEEGKGQHVRRGRYDSQRQAAFFYRKFPLLSSFSQELKASVSEGLYSR